MHIRSCGIVKIEYRLVIVSWCLVIYNPQMLSKTLILCFLTVPLAASALVSVGGDYFLKPSETAADDIYVIGTVSTFGGEVAGDAVALSRMILSDGLIAADALFVGEAVTLQGAVQDDARLAGETVLIGGTVKDDVVAFGAKVRVLPTAHIGGNLYIVGGDVEVRGAVAGDVRLHAGSTKVSGTVGGTLESWGTIEIGEHTVIGRDFIVHSPRKPTVPSSAMIAGETVYDERSGGTLGVSLLPAFMGGLFSIHALMALALGFFLFFFAKDRTEEVLLDVLPEFWRRLLRGMLVLFLMPIAIALLLGSVIGIPIALVLIALFAALVITSSVFGGIMLGAWAERAFFKRSAFPITYRPVLIGTVFLSLIVALPLVGAVMHLMLMCAAAGSISTVFYRHVRELR